MTALCPGGGPSGPLPGTDSTIALTGVSIDAMLAAAGYPELGPVIGVLAATWAVLTDDFCTIDPPADPGLTLADITAAMTPQDPLSFAAASGRIRDWFMHWYWYQVCGCTSGGTPAAPTLVAPTGVGTNTNLPAGGAVQPCWTATRAGQLGPKSTGTIPTYMDITDTIVPASETIQVNHPWSGGVAFAPHQPGTTGQPYSLAFNLAMAGAFAGGTMDFYISWYGTSGALVNNQDYYSLGSTGSVTNVPISINAGGVYWWWTVINNDANPHTFTLTLEINCGNTIGNNPNTPCCPPDPLVQTYLQNILSLLGQIYIGLPVPLTSYADSTVHTGLSGTGTIVLSTGTIGVRAHFTAIPPSFGGTMGSPPQWYGAGELVASASTYPLQTFRVQYDDQVFALPSLTTELDYTLPVGVTLTVTELVRGP